MSDKNTIEFGIENLHIAILNKENATFGAPESIPGTVGLKLSGKMEEIKIFADNGVLFQASNNTGYEGELEIYNFDDDFKVKYLGFEKDKNGVLVEPEIIIPKNLALLFKVLGDSKDRVSVLYNVTFEKPDYEVKTLQGKIEVQVMKLKLKAIPLKFADYDKKLIQASTIDDTKKATWFTEVYKPVKQA